MRRVILAALGCAFLALILACGGGTSAPRQQAEKKEEPAPEQTEKEKRNSDRVTAHSLTRDFIKQFLKHPDDATFEPIDTDKIAYDENFDWYTVTGVVKAKNSFGVTSNMTYQLDVRIDGDKGTPMRVILDGETVATSDAFKQAMSDLAAQESIEIKEQMEKERLAEAARKKAEEEAEQKRIEEEKIANRPKAAASKLALAKQLIEKDLKPTAKKRLQELIKEYPETPAAKEAQELLDSL